MIGRGILLAVPLLALPAVAKAQSDRSTTPLEGVVAPVAPEGGSGSFANGIDFDLSVSEDESKASAQISGYRVRDTYFEGSGQTSMSWSVKLAVPVGGGDDITSSSTVDTLAKGTKLSASISFFGFKDAAPRLATQPFLGYMDRARSLCDEGIAAGHGNDEGAVETTSRQCLDAGLDPDFVLRHRAATEDQVARALYSGMWRLGLEGSVAFDRFEYFAPVTLTGQNDTKLEYEAALFGAYYFPNARSALIFRLAYQNGFEGADAAVICKPVVVDPADDCVNGSPSAPAHVEKLNVSADYRQTFALGTSGASLGISPKVTLDALSGDWEAEFPVYYIPKKGWPIAPGASVSYSSEKDKVDFRLFMRASFAFE